MKYAFKDLLFISFTSNSEFFDKSRLQVVLLLPLKFEDVCAAFSPCS